jgi:hypothetical protein
VDTLPFALVRIGASLAIVADLLRVASLGLVPRLFVQGQHGGFGAESDSAYVLDPVFGQTGGLWAYGVSLTCMVLTALGIGTRPAMLLGVLAYAQLGHLFPPGDRAIDRVLRCVLLLLLFTNAHRRLSLGNLLRKRAAVLTMPGWADDVLRLFLVIVYMAAGTAKLMQQPHWLGASGRPVLYRVVTDPLAGRLDPEAWESMSALFFVGGWGTIALELSALLLFTRVAPYWALVGATMHVGIAFTMELGMFSWGMLSLYPVLLAPLVTRWRSRA